MCREFDKLRERVWELEVIFERKDNIADIPLEEALNILGMNDADVEEILMNLDGVELDED